VLDFGAVSGGAAAANTTAINLALASGAKEVYIPSGTFLVSAPLIVASDQVVYGNGSGSVIKLAANTHVFSVTGVSNVTLKNFTIDGDRTTYTNNANNGIYSLASGSGSTNVEVSGMRLINLGGAGVLFLAQTSSHSSNIRIINNYIFNTGTHGIICQDYVDDTLIAYNRVENFGLLVADRPGITTGRSGSRHRVLGNYVKCSGSALGTSVHGISIDATATFVCNDNILENTIGFGIEIGGGTIGSVVGNTVINSVNAGIAIGGSVLDVVDVTVSGNVIRNSAAQGIYLYKGSTTLTQRVSITGNAVYNAGQNGIEVADACSDITVTGNTVLACVLSGVWVNKSNNLIITNNDIRGNNTAANAAHAGIRVINTTSETAMLINWNIVTGSGVRNFGIDNPITNKGDSDRVVQVFPVATPNPSIVNGDVFKTGDAGVINAITGGTVNGEQIKILALHAATVVNGASLKTSTLANKVLTVNCLYTFTYIDGVWYESATA
jgi:hypothetical protein